MRTTEEIYQTLKTAFAERSGFEPGDGCDLSVRLWAAAAQIQALEMQADWVLDQSFPQTASGVYLERHGVMRGITRLPGTRAAGVLRFYRQDTAEPMTVAAGTVCMTAGEKRFQTTADAVIGAGETWGEAPAEAMESGSGGNAVAGAVCVLTACPVSVTGCTNPAAFTGGSEEESDQSLRKRIMESYQRLPNGANAAWYETTALSHQGVAAAKAVGRARGIGTVDVYIAGESGLPTESVLTEVQADLQQRREIAVDVRVLSPTTEAVDVTVQLAAAEGYGFDAVKAAAEEAVLAFFTGRLLGEPVRLAELGSRIYGVEGVENYHLLSPVADLAGDDTVLPVLGALRVTELEG